MLRLILRTILMAALLSGLAVSQSPVYLPNAVRAGGNLPNASFSGPLLGFAFDEAANRFVSYRGIPGAATSGPPLLLDQSLQSVEVAPSQDFALAATGSDLTPVVVTLTGASAVIAAIPGAESAPTRIFLSPSGTAGLLYHQASGRLQVITGLPSAPSVAANLSDFHAGAELSAAAISDDGTAALLGLWDGHSGSLYRLGRDGAEDLIWSAGRISAATFLAGSNSALAADQDNSVVKRFDLASGAVQMSVIADSGSGLASPRALASSADNHAAFVLNGNGSLSILNLGGGTPLSLSCSCRPDGLHRLAGNDVFRLTDPSAGPTWLLVAGVDSPRLAFIPADAGSRFQTPTPVRVTQ